MQENPLDSIPTSVMPLRLRKIIEPFFGAVAAEVGADAGREALLISDVVMARFAMHLCYAIHVGACAALKHGTALLNDPEVREWLAGESAFNKGEAS